MKFFALFCLLVCAYVSAQDNEVKYIIDPFTIETPAIVIIIPSEGISEGNPIVESEIVSGNNIMGEERDLILNATSGNGNLLLSTGVSGGQFSAATPNNARGNSLYQLDGIDNSIDLNPAGLLNHPNNNFLAGDAFALRVLMESDLPGFVTFRLYSGSRGTLCQIRKDLFGDDTLHEYIIPYSSFETQNCDFSNIGAIEIFILMNDNIDVIIQDFSTWGPEQTCRCECPAFTCRLYFDLDDNNFSYYRTSQFGVFNPTTDLSTIYTTNTITFPSFSTDITTIFSTDFTTIFSTDFTSFTSFFTSFDSFSIIDDDDDNNSPNSPDDSSSDAGVISFSVALIAMIVVALF